MPWVVLVLLLALAGGVLGTLLQFALWTVVLTVLGFLLLGSLLQFALTSRSGSVDPGGRW